MEGVEMKNNNSKPLSGYGQYYRSGITMKQKWTMEKVLQQDKRQSALDSQGKSLMGRNQ
jgi:hypothetical protein